MTAYLSLFPFLCWCLPFPFFILAVHCSLLPFGFLILSPFPRHHVLLPKQKLSLFLYNAFYILKISFFIFRCPSMLTCVFFCVYILYTKQNREKLITSRFLPPSHIPFQNETIHNTQYIFCSLSLCVFFLAIIQPNSLKNYYTLK